MVAAVKSIASETTDTGANKWAYSIDAIGIRNTRRRVYNYNTHQCLSGIRAIEH